MDCREGPPSFAGVYFFLTNHRDSLLAMFGYIGSVGLLEIQVHAFRIHTFTYLNMYLRMFIYIPQHLLGRWRRMLAL